VYRHFRILGVELGLLGPEALIEPILRAYRRFSIAAPSDRNGCISIEFRESRNEAVVSGRVIPLVPGLDPASQLHQHFQRAMLDALDGVAVLHAAALLDRAGRALVIGAPSRHGKSLLALELACRGFGFMSDDYAPLDLERRLVLPYPRAVGIRPTAEAPIPEPFRPPVDAPEHETLAGKRLQDVGDVLGESALARDPAPLGHVVLLSASDAEPEPPTIVRLATRTAEAPALDDLFSRTPGVEILKRADAPGLRSWSLRLDHRRHPSPAISAVLDSDGVVQMGTSRGRPPDFTAGPRAVRLPRRAAAMLLARELLNRGARSRLLANYGGDAAGIFVDLAAALRDTPCWRVRAGEIVETATLIEKIVASDRPARPPSGVSGKPAGATRTARRRNTARS